MSMCWCKDCEWFYKEHCVNGLSDNHMEEVEDHGSCEYSELRKYVQSEFSKGYNEGYSEAVKSIKRTREDSKKSIKMTEYDIGFTDGFVAGKKHVNRKENSNE